MTALALAALLLAGEGDAPRPSAPLSESYAQVTVREHIIIRVPVRRAPRAPAAESYSAPAAPLRWRERGGPDCLPLKALAGADALERDRVDFILRDGTRMRARLERSCPALDFYSGFYIRPTKDGRICADRDSIRARSGGECGITAFRKLVPDR